MSQNIFSKLQNALRRTTSAHSGWLREVDGLRFVAIFVVILQHLLERFSRHSALHFQQPLLDDPIAFFISRGTVGVFLFFAISGFVLALPFAKYHLDGAQKPGLRTYFLRRVTRLEPPYFVWMTLFAAVLLVRGAFSWDEIQPHLLTSLTYTHGLFFGQHSPINPVAWSLEVEIQFYLLAPFLAALFFRIKNKTDRRTALIFAILGWNILQSHFGWWFFPYKLTLLGQLPHFLVGFLVADFFLTDWKNGARQHLFWDLVAVLGYVAMCYTWTTEFWKNLAFATALFGLFTAAFRGVFFRRILQNGWIAVAGGMCYTIYLIHLPLLEALTILAKNMVFTSKIWVNFGLQAMIFLPIVWILGAVFFLILEKPFMCFSWKNWGAACPGFLFQNFKTRTFSIFLSQKIGRFRSRLGIFGLFLLLSFAAKTQNSDSLRLRPLSDLIENAQKNAPEIRANQSDQARQALVVEVQRKNWADLFSMNGTAYFGNGTVNEIRSADGLQNEYATGRLGTGINLTFGVKLSGGDLTTRRQKTQIQVLQLDRLQNERQMLENQLRDAVTAQYFQLENVLAVVRLRAESLETLRLSMAVAEKYFRAGTLPVGEYTSLLGQETMAREQFLRAQNEAKQRAMELRNLTGGEIWER